MFFQRINMTAGHGQEPGTRPWLHAWFYLFLGTSGVVASCPVLDCTQLKASADENKQRTSGTAALVLGASAARQARVMSVVTQKNEY